MFGTGGIPEEKSIFNVLVLKLLIPIAVSEILVTLFYHFIYKVLWHKRHPGHANLLKSCKLKAPYTIWFANDEFGQMFVELNKSKAKIITTE